MRFLRKKTNWRRIIKYFLTIAVFCYLLLCFAQKLPVRDAVSGNGDCRLYYIVNVDGMKGLGHSILLLVDKQGEGCVLSFNGMQRTLGEALLGRAGVGKLTVGHLDAAETAGFLSSGNLDLEGDQLDDNYDVALYRAITQDEYQTVLLLTEPYLQAGTAYERLYVQAVSCTDAEEQARYQTQLEHMGQDDSLPLYQIYTHNCDHAARLLTAAIDNDMAAYNTVSKKLTPNGNFKAFARRTSDWGVLYLGESTILERALEFFMIF